VRKNDPGIGKVKEECYGQISTLDLSRLPVKGDSMLLRNDGMSTKLRSVVSHNTVIFLMNTNFTKKIKRTFISLTYF